MYIQSLYKNTRGMLMAQVVGKYILFIEKVDSNREPTWNTKSLRVVLDTSFFSLFFSPLSGIVRRPSKCSHKNRIICSGFVPNTICLESATFMIPPSNSFTARDENEVFSLFFPSRSPRKHTSHCSPGGARSGRFLQCRMPHPHNAMLEE